MQEIIEEPKQGIIRHYCDGCGQLMFTEGSLSDNLNLLIEPALAINANFGNKSELIGVYFDKEYCSICGVNIVEALEKLFNCKIEANYQGRIMY